MLHVDDAADALVHLMTHYSGESHVNVGSGTDLTILELATKIASVVDFRGGLTTDRSMPDGTPQKLLDVSKLADLGWQPKIGLEEGLAGTYQWYLDNFSQEREQLRAPGPQRSARAGVLRERLD